MQDSCYTFLGIEKFNGASTILRFRKTGTYDRALKIKASELFATRPDIIRSLDGETAVVLSKFLDDKVNVSITEASYSYKYLLFLSALFIGAVNSAHFVSALYFYIGDWRVGIAVIPMTVSFILNAVIAEVYAFKNARAVLWGSFVISLITFVVQWLYATYISQSNDYTNFLPINTIGSMIAYFFADFSNNKILVKLKASNTSLLYRIFASNMFAHLLDSILYISLSQMLFLSFDRVATLTYQMIVMKTFREILIVVPLVIIISTFLKKKEGLSQDEGEVKTSFFSIDTTYRDEQLYTPKLA